MKQEIHSGRLVLDIIIVVFTIATYFYAMNDYFEIAVKGVAFTLLLLVIRVLAGGNPFHKSNQKDRKA